jgi:hypothetical protein
MEWYRKKPELFIYHPADSANFWKERGETKQLTIQEVIFDIFSILLPISLFDF